MHWQLMVLLLNEMVVLLLEMIMNVSRSQYSHGLCGAILQTQPAVMDEILVNLALYRQFLIVQLGKPSSTVFDPLRGEYQVLIFVKIRVGMNGLVLIIWHESIGRSSS